MALLTIKASTIDPTGSFNFQGTDYLKDDIEAVYIKNEIFSNGTLTIRDFIGLKDRYLDAWLYYPTKWENYTEDGSTLEVSFSAASDMIEGYLASSTGASYPAGGSTAQVLAKASAADDDVEWVNAAGGGDALVANPLSQFAATTIVQLNATISDATISTATGVEDNADVTDTANVTSAGALMDSEVTNLADVKAFDTTDYATEAQGTLAASASQATGVEDNAEVNTINSTITGEPSGSDVVLNVVSLTQAEYDAGTPESTTFYIITDAEPTGYLAIPQNSQSAAYTLVLADAGKHVLHPSADTTARIFTIPANASVAFPIGTAVTFINQNAGGVITIAITTDTMRLAGDGTTGSRTLAANGTATAVKITTTEWLISGINLT